MPQKINANKSKKKKKKKKNSTSTAEDMGSIPGQGTKIPYTVWHSKKKKV